MTDFSVPQRMSLGAFFIYFLNFFKLIFKAIIIVLAYKIFTSEGGFSDVLVRILIVIGSVAAIALIVAALAYFKIKFHVEGGNLIYKHSLIGRATTTIPLEKIHTLRTRRGLFYQMLNLRGVVFDTLAAKGTEIELILSESDWQALINQIERQEKPEAASTEAQSDSNFSSYKKFSNKDLILDALCQNHLKGMVVLGGFFAVIFNNLSDLSEETIDRIADYLETHLSYFAVSVAGIAIIMACTYLVSLLLWLGKVLFRYFDLSLTYNSRILTFNHGLFSRLSSRFARDKICTVWIKRNYFEKRLGLGTLAMKQALNSSAQKEEDNLKIYGKDCSEFFLGWWLGKDYSTEPVITSAKSGRGVVIRTLLPDLLLSLAATAVLAYFGRYGWIIVPAIYLMASLPKGILTMRHSSITLKESYIIVGNGRFAEIKNYLKYENVEVVRIQSSPLTRFSGRVSLTLSTTGSTLTVRSLRKDRALYIYELLLAENHAYASPQKEELTP